MCWFSGKFDFESIKNVSLRERIIAVEAFLDEHYIFRYDDRYKSSAGTLNLAQDIRHVSNDVNHQERNSFLDTREGDDGFSPVFFAVSLEKQFSNMLLKFIEAKGRNHVEVYKRANIDRKLFSKICSQEGYLPSKKTVVALVIALELSLDEALELLKIAGFTLSNAILFDVIIEYHIVNKRYDIFEINEILAAYKLTPIGGEASS